LHPTRNDDGEIEEVSYLDAFLQFFSIGWKVFFSLCPPCQMWGGWACFFAALIMIGVVTAVVAEVANVMGCLLGLKPGVTAITFVAIGTSLPDTFASKHAA
jgi:solute carrier family 8 (sodium/calcium exchanger)